MSFVVVLSLSPFRLTSRVVRHQEPQESTSTPDVEGWIQCRVRGDRVVGDLVGDGSGGGSVVVRWKGGQSSKESWR